MSDLKRSDSGTQFIFSVERAKAKGRFFFIQLVGDECQITYLSAIILKSK